MKTKNAARRKIPKTFTVELPETIIKAKGDSIWRNTKGLVIPIYGKATYTHIMSSEGAGFSRADFLTLDIGKGLPFCYTDSGVEQAVAEVECLYLKTRFGCDDVKLTWSEQGMQGEGVWNFDVTLLWK